jgi:purine nucleosidase
MKATQKIIIDTDPGIDDALAIFLALASPELEVVALTAVFGNASVDVTTSAALALLEIAGRTEIPVAAGAAAPLAGPYRGAVPDIHGHDGQGDYGMAAPSGQPVASSAAKFLAERTAASPGEISIVALGPLTNLALALAAHPEIARHAAGIVGMGGNALAPGNATPAAEANILSDPEAADIVFGAGWPVTMVGLDVTHKALLTDADAARIAASRKPTSRHIAAALPLYRAFYERVPRVAGVYLHDPSAVAFLIDPALFQTKRWPLRVETLGMSRGKTWPWTREHSDPAGTPWAGRPGVEVCVDVDAARLVELVVSRLS